MVWLGGAWRLGTTFATRDDLDAFVRLTADETRSTSWEQARLGRALARLLQADAPADIAALVREICRLGDGHVTLPRVLTQQLDLRDASRRFGLEGSLQNATSNWTFRTTPDAQGHIPAALRLELDRVLDLDSVVRRTDAPAPPDGAFLRLAPGRFPDYRNSTQKLAFQALLTMPEGATLLVTLKTGAGKSLLFQAGVRWWTEQHPDEPASAIVVVPTVSLADDHVKSIRDRFPELTGSAALTGRLSDAARRKVLDEFASGNVPLLFMAPEMLAGKHRKEFLEALAPRGERALVAEARLTAVFVDEAHIIESWGRSFRPDFQRLGGVVETMRRINPALRVVLLSATVTKPALKALRGQFCRTGPYLQVREGLPRTEHDIVLHSFETQTERLEGLLDLVDLLPRPAIIYTTRVRADPPSDEVQARLGAEDLLELIQARGYTRCASYTGETPGNERRSVVEGWRDGTIDLVVATSAFGMGVDNQEVRAVVHACLPETPARWYQEIGRAGRDGHQAVAILLTAPGDEEDAAAFAAGTVLKHETAARRWGFLVRSRTVEETPEGRVHRFSLDAARSGTHTGRLHRRWNKALLVQLQRYGALEVLGFDPDGSEWSVRFHEAYADFADEDSEQAEKLFKALFAAKRAAALRVARSESARFRETLFPESGRDRCQYHQVFRRVDGASLGSAFCGRCPACRARERPSTLHTLAPRGVDGAWVVEGARRPVAETLLVPDSLFSEPASAVQALLDRGVELFLAPALLCTKLAAATQNVEMSAGLVVPWDALMRDQPQLVASRPAALLFGPFETQAVRRRVVGKVQELVDQGFLDLRYRVTGPHDEVASSLMAETASVHVHHLERFVEGSA